MTGIPTFLPSADESKAVIPIAAAFQEPAAQAEPVLLLPNGQQQAIPRSLSEILAIASQALMRGYAVSLTVHSGMLSTQQVADMLACSRQHVVRLIDEGKLTATRTPGGTHRRVRLSDVLEFMKNEDVRRDELMDELTALTEEIGGYDDIHRWKQARGHKR